MFAILGTSTRSRQRLHHLNSINIILIALSICSCSKDKPNQAIIEKHCYDEIISHIKQKPLSRIEKSFFRDRRAHDVLKLEQISPSEYAEGTSSATAANYIQEFSFIDRKGKTVKLIRSEKNGGVDVQGGNIVTPRIQCTVTWGLFKGKVMRENLKVIMVKLDSLQQKMRSLDTVTEGKW